MDPFFHELIFQNLVNNPQYDPVHSQPQDYGYQQPPQSNFAPQQVPQPMNNEFNNNLPVSPYMQEQQNNYEMQPL